MPSRNHKRALRSHAIQFEGRKYGVERTISVAGRIFQVLEKLSGERERYLVFDRSAGPAGNLRALHVYSKSRDLFQKLRRLERLDSHFPHLVSYHSNGNRVFVLWSWVRGIPLDRQLAAVAAHKTPRPSPVQALQMIRGLAHGIGKFNHRLNMGHGDIKPANLILANESTHLSLIDFGSAWVTERTVKQVGKGDGFARHDVYAAPEQRQPGLYPDFRSDLFSVSVVLYELLTLRIPYDGLGGGAGANARYRAEFADALEPPSTYCQRNDRTPQIIWFALDNITRRGLALDPNKRYPNREEWLADLDDAFARTRERPTLSGPNRFFVKVLLSVQNAFRRLRKSLSHDDESRNPIGAQRREYRRS